MSNEKQSRPQRNTGAIPQLRKAPQPGDILDGTYRIDQVLGYGGVGVVCAGWHLHVQRSCAVKFLHPQLVGDPELRARFRREAQSAFQLGHPHIVAITDFRDDPEGWPYIVMELVSGETLRSRLDRGPLPPMLAVRLMAELCDALNTAHRRGVIHRDLKPENLFLTPADNDDDQGEDAVFLKVLDFGLSKILDESDITETGRLLGSPSYMSPEQARGDSHLVDARSDIFAVGSLLYECLTGAKLFEAPSFEHKRQLIMAARLPAMKLAQRGAPASLEVVIRTCCAQRPEDRYQSALALMEALAPIFPGEGAVVAAAVRKDVSGRITIGQILSHSSPPPVPPVSPSAATPQALPPPLVLPAPAGPPAPPPAASATSQQSASIQGGELVPSSATGSVPRRRTSIWAAVVVGGMALGAVAVLLGYNHLRSAGPPRVQAIGAPEGTKAGPVPDRPDRPSDARAVTSSRPPASHPPRVQHSEHQTPADKLTIGLVDGVMLRARPSIARCFPEGAAPPRRLQVDAIVSPSGHVNEATTDAPEEEAGCVVDTLRGVRFPSFRGEPVSVHYEFMNLQR